MEESDFEGPQDLRDVKNDKEFVVKREEILSMIWDMEEEIMGKEI